MQYIPEDGVYVYFRYDGNQTVMCVMNTNTTEKTIDTNRFSERTNGFKKGIDIPTGKAYELGGSLKLRPMSMLVLNLGV